MGIGRKVLWIVRLDKDEASFKEHVEAAGIDTVCIRTTTSRLPSAIDTYHRLGKSVWAWRWPGVEDATGYGPHYFAPLEANFVASELIPAGLQGYIVDPESNDNQKPNDWNQKTVNGVSVAVLAREFCAVIRKAAKGREFVFGTTSGCEFPGPRGKTELPWKEFFAPSHALYPQCYWRWTNSKGAIKDINGGTPEKAIERGLQAWTPRSKGKPIIPMAGEIDLVTPEEITAYGNKLKEMNLNEAHFYADLPNVKPDVLAAIKAL